MFEASWPILGPMLKQFHGLAQEQWMTGPPVRCDDTSMRWRNTQESMRSKTQSADSPDEEMDGVEQMDEDEVVSLSKMSP